MYVSLRSNPLAGTTANTLNQKYANLATSTQRLSTGLRINSAADDASGLAVRELMRADIAATNQGIRNVNDAISLLQTMDGALSIIDEKLIRLKELAEQAATGSYDSVQRLMIDSEFQMMASEIGRIAQAADWNGIQLLEGEYNIQNTSNTSNNISYTYTKSTFNILNNIPATFVKETRVIPLTAQASVSESIVTLNDASKLSGTTTITVYNKNTSLINDTSVSAALYRHAENLTIPDSLNIQWSDSEYWRDTSTIPPTFKQGSWIVNDPQYSRDFSPNEAGEYDTRPNSLDIFFETDKFAEIFIGTSEALNNGDSTTINLIEIDQNPQYNYTISGAAGNFSGTITLPKDSSELNFVFDLGNGNIFSQEFTLSDGLSNAFTLSGFTSTLTITENALDNQDIQVNPLSIPDDVIKIHFGPTNSASEDYYYIDKSDATLSGLGLDNLSITTQDSAQAALQTIDDAIVKKDTIRAYYGAMQNRLENTMAQLRLQAENLQIAESRISDIDIAQEMTHFIKNQILSQSAIAMLAQANSMPQMALRLIS